MREPDSHPPQTSKKTGRHPDLYACLYVREFPAQALLRIRAQLNLALNPDFNTQPIAILDGEPPQQHVCSLNTRARQQGVEPGMTRVELETIPTVLPLRRSLQEEASARTAILQAVAQFSPRIEDCSQISSHTFSCLLDITGTTRLLGPPPVLARALQTTIRELGIHASLAISHNAHTAISLARGTQARGAHAVQNLARGPIFVPAGQEGQALAPLPLAVLDLPPEHAETLALWGIETLGSLAALPESGLISRLGQAGLRYRQMALGQLPHHFVPIDVPFTLSEHLQLDTPLESLDSLLFVIGILLDHLIRRATAHILALASVTVTLTLERAQPHTRSVRPALPTNDRPLWLKLLHLDLEAHPPQAAILAVTLDAEHGTTSKVQLGLFAPQLPESMRLDVTLARIRSIVGEDNAGSPVLKDTHQPDQLSLQPFTVPDASKSTKPAPASPQSTTAIRQLRPPENTLVTFRNQYPHTFTFREKRYSVEHAYGPWHSAGDWWNTATWQLTQWDLIARAPDGHLLCCCLVVLPTANRHQITAIYD